MWQCEVLDLLFRKGFHIVLEAKPKDMSNEDWRFVNWQACGTIRLCLAKDQKYFVMKETLATNEVKFSDVSNALVNNEYRRKDQFEHTDTTPEALTVSTGKTNNRKFDKSNGRGRSRSKGESSWRHPTKDECAYCHQKGHWKKDCPNKDKSTANVAQNASDEEDSAFSVSSSDNPSDRWILDSGCSYHMCPNRHWFSSLEELDGFWTLDAPIICVQIGIGSQVLRSLMEVLL
ncbi:hypothetical protein Acr_06g0007310 [Actinidia rufa]|uniref:CCHC-type domain-containing protein n=1 Tax=Actinidia rufa TaxID=165716 RepID=A0A7J0EQN1_9ERIC|nr:hypothetical protein Acr_06g0007310 [Actinidia rufa]